MLGATEVSILSALLSAPLSETERTKYLCPLRDIPAIAYLADAARESYLDVSVMGNDVRRLVDRIEDPLEYFMSEDSDSAMSFLVIPSDYHSIFENVPSFESIMYDFIRDNVATVPMSVLDSQLNEEPAPRYRITSPHSYPYRIVVMKEDWRFPKIAICDMSKWNLISSLVAGRMTTTTFTICTESPRATPVPSSGVIKGDAEWLIEALDDPPEGPQSLLHHIDMPRAEATLGVNSWQVGFRIYEYTTLPEDHIVILIAPRDFAGEP